MTDHSSAGGCRVRGRLRGAGCRRPCRRSGRGRSVGRSPPFPAHWDSEPRSGRLSHSPSSRPCRPGPASDRRSPRTDRAASRHRSSGRAGRGFRSSRGSSGVVELGAVGREATAVANAEPALHPELDIGDVAAGPVDLRNRDPVVRVAQRQRVVVRAVDDRRLVQPAPRPVGEETGFATTPDGPSTR